MSIESEDLMRQAMERPNKDVEESWMQDTRGLLTEIRDLLKTINRRDRREAQKRKESKKLVE